MFVSETTIRVRYAETDQMGYVYYGNYATFYEVARVEALRGIGMTYRGLEEQGVLMPVLELKSKFIRPAKYDDLLTIKTTIAKMPSTRMFFGYEVFNEGKELINIGETTLVFIDKLTGRPCNAPQALEVLMKPFFNEK
jgi:acyl-CoA thioester hydrolase